MEKSHLADGGRNRARRSGAKHARAALGDVSNSNCIITSPEVKPVKVRRSSRLALSEPNDEAVKTFNLDPDETQQISQLKGKSNKRNNRNIRSTSHEGVSGEIVANATTEFKSKRRRVNACRSANSSYRNDSHGHARFFGMHASSPFDLTEYTVGFSKHDKCSRGNALQVPEYVCDIFQRLFLIETKLQNNASRLHPSMDNQPELSPTMRMIVVDWLVEVHAKFRLDPTTLHLCIHIFDRYLSSEEVSRSQVQLVAVTSLLLASKYEEIYPPMIKDCVYVTDKAYSREDILQMESKILIKLNFNISEPTGYPFLLRFLFITDATPLMESAANYYMDRMLQDPDYLKYRPSLFAAAAVCLAINNDDICSSEEIESKPGIPLSLLEYTGFLAGEILEVASLIVSKISKSVVLASKRQLFAVKEKYSHPDFERVALDIHPPDIAGLSNGN